MKKLILLAIGLILLTGCSFININDLNYDQIVDKVMTSKSPKANTAMSGYKLYLPRNYKIYDNKDTNIVLYSGGKRIYLFVDLVSYYEKENNIYEIDTVKNKIYENKLTDKKNGYVTISKNSDKYYIQVMYNYAKIEALVDKNDVKFILSESLNILKTIKYNDVIIKKLIGNEDYTTNEEDYDLLKPNANATNFLDYLKDYDDVDNELPDDDEIQVEE